MQPLPSTHYQNLNVPCKYSAVMGSLCSALIPDPASFKLAWCQCSTSPCQRNDRTKIWPHGCMITDQVVEAGRDLNSTDFTVTPVKKRLAERHRNMMEK